MITQAIKQWLRKMFAWWPWRQSAGTGYPHSSGPLSQGATQEMTARSTIDGVAPRRPTIEEWPERVVYPSPPILEERSESIFTSSPLPTPPIEKSRGTVSGEVSSSDSSSAPIPERQLEFLRYLVERGIVNEGFSEGNIPEQYRKE